MLTPAAVSAATAPRHLWCGATKIEVDVVDSVGSSQFFDSPSEHRWVASVQLQRTKCFVGTKLHHRVGLFVSVH
jgi:hypothetical protein